TASTANVTAHIQEPMSVKSRCSSRRRKLQRMNTAQDPGSAAGAGDLKIVIGLDAHPELGRDIEQSSQFQCHFGRHTAFAQDNLANGDWGRADGLGHSVRGEAKRLHKVLTKDVTRMNGSSLFLRLLIPIL